MQYCLPEIPSIYWVNKAQYSCKACRQVFDLYRPNGDDLVKFMESNGTEIRWLPTYGKGGYLDLFEKFMPGFMASGKKIIHPVTLRFMNQLQNHIEPSGSGNGFEQSTGKAHCPRCASLDIKEVSEEVLTSPEVVWLKIDCELLK